MKISLVAVMDAFEPKVDKWTSLDKDYQPSDLVYIPSKYCIEQQKTMLLRKDALISLTKMLNKAYDGAINIKCVSAFRSYEYQETLYSNAVQKYGTKQDSVAKPGHSEHQLGLAVDLSSDENSYELTASFAKTNAYKWLSTNASNFDFYFSYTKENHKEKGYAWEPWHLRYFAKPRQTTL